MKKNNDFFKKVLEISNLSLSAAAPLALCIFISILIQRKLHTGYWVIIVGIAIGIAAMVNTFYRYYKKVIKDIEKEDSHPPSKNSHD